MDLREAQQAVDAWISSLEEGYFSPLSNLARLIEEVGELARDLNHRYGEKPPKPGEEPGDPAMEMADILFVIIALANSMEIDLQTAFDRVMEKVKRRDAGRFTPRDPGPGEVSSGGPDEVLP